MLWPWFSVAGGSVGYGRAVINELDAFRNEAAAWIGAHREFAPPNYGAIMPERFYDDGVAWQRRLFNAGWAGIHWPAEHGGRGLTPAHQAVWLEVCAEAEVPPFINMVGFVLAGQALQLYGTDAQKTQHLKAIIQADQVWCQLFSEPDAGSDLASLSTTAIADGDEWVVNGQKVWCSGGHFSDWGILMARTDADAPKHRGISFFIVDMATPGIDTRPLRQMTGETEFDEVFFDHVRLPSDALLGAVHDGWRVAMTTLTNERGSIGAAAIGAQRRLDALRNLGGEAGLDPTERSRLIGLLNRGKAYSYMGMRQGPDASIGSSLNKLGITELSFDIAELRADLAGPHGMVSGPASHSLLAAPGGRIAGGSSQIQRNLIGERILGLPKDPG